MAEDMEMDQSRAAQAQLREVLGMSTPFSFGGSGTAKKSERETEEEDKDLQPAPKFPRGQNKGAQGGKGWKEAQNSYTGQGWWGNKARGSQEDPWADASSRSGGKLPDLATQHLLQVVVKMVTRHEEELARIRIDTNFMMFMDVMQEGVYDLMKLTAEQWHAKFTAKKVTASLRVMLMLALLGEIQDRMVKTVESEEQLQRCLDIGWMAEGSTKLNPVYRYYRWNPETRTQEHCETPPLSHTTALTHVQTLQEMVVQPNVLTRFRSTRPLS